LTGGKTGNNTFNFANGGSVTGLVIGNTVGTNTLNYSNYGSAVSVNLQNGAATGTATGLGNFWNINSFVGDATNYGSLTGQNSVSTTWALSGTNSGTLTGTGLAVGFSNFANLTAGNGNASVANVFTFAYPTMITGTITGGTNTASAGPNTSNTNLNYSNYSNITMTVSGQEAGNIRDATTSSAPLVANFANINTVLGNGTDAITIVGQKANQITITGYQAGYINDPLYFAGFNSVDGNNSTQLNFSASPAAVVVNNTSGSISGTSSFINFSNLTGVNAVTVTPPPVVTAPVVMAPVVTVSTPVTPTEVNNVSNNVSDVQSTEYWLTQQAVQDQAPAAVTETVVLPSQGSFMDMIKVNYDENKENKKTYFIPNCTKGNTKNCSGFTVSIK
jgi:hypothetical protein